MMVLPSLISRSAVSASDPSGTLKRSSRRGCADEYLPSVNCGAHTVAGDVFEVLDGLIVGQPATLQLVEHGLGEGVTAPGLSSASQAEQFVLGDTCSDKNVGDARLAFGQRASLVEDDRLDLGGLLQRHRLLEQHAAFGGHVGGDHHGRGRCQAERIGAGDHHGGDGKRQRQEQWLASDEQPDQEREHTRADGDQRQVVRGTVGQPLRRGLAVLRRLDHADDLRQRRIRADFGGAKRSEPAWLIVPAMTWSPGPFSTGRLSPVTMLSSMLLAPSMTSPSTGTLSPGLSTSTSPTTTSATGSSICRPSRSTVAVCGARSNSFRH